MTNEDEQQTLHLIHKREENEGHLAEIVRARESGISSSFN